MELFKKHDVFVISDEIWSDLILDGYKHIPTQSVSEDAKQRTVAMYAPSKTFNLAGLVGSYSIVYNTWLKDRMDKEISLSHTNAMNVLSMYALMGAYSDEGHVWLEELRQVLTGNVDFACDYIRTHFEGVTVSRPQGTYMLFVDCTAWCQTHGKTIDDVLKACYDVGVAVQDGRQFHGSCHIRMNLASPLSRIGGLPPAGPVCFQRLSERKVARPLSAVKCPIRPKNHSGSSGFLLPSSHRNAVREVPHSQHCVDCRIPTQIFGCFVQENKCPCAIFTNFTM